jgi:uncharacterized protein YdeI (YjbR/CyaY-like superfamily)
MNVRQFINDQPAPQREIMTVLRSWVFDLGQHVQEKISHQIPYFYFFGPLCYVNPVSDGIEFGLLKGHELSDDQKILESKGRKHVRSVAFSSVAELEENEELIRRLLNEAAILNEYLDKRRRKNK